jgi:MFS transporter, UMF1 family
MKAPGDRAMVSWALYDWANSAFATTVMAGFFPIFFKQFWNHGVDPVVSTARLGMGNSVAGIFIAVLAPVLGAIADRGAAKKRFLFSFALLGMATTASLALVPTGSWAVAVAFYTLAIIGFSGGNVFYDSLIVSVARESRMHFVSALGFSLGYLGGGLLFAFNVLMAVNPALFGLSGPAQAVRLSFLSVAFWWCLFSLPLLLFVKEKGTGQRQAGMDMVRAGLMQLKETFSEIRRERVIFLFLLAYWFYIDGVDTVVLMAVDYGLSLGFNSNDLIKALLITQFVGFPCALLFGFLGQRIGAKRSIFIAIGVYLFLSLWGSFIHARGEFYLMAAIVGMVQGGIQSLSRSFYARLIPPGKSGEYFGFYNMLGKFAVIVGPVLIGTVELTLRSMGVEGALVPRLGITSLSVLFLVGGLLLFFVDERGAVIQQTEPEQGKS